MREVRFTLRIPEALNRKIGERADREGCSKNTYIVEACDAFIRQKREEWSSESEGTSEVDGRRLVNSEPTALGRKL